MDCLVTLPNPPGPIAIDAKFPLESYRALREAATRPRWRRRAGEFCASDPHACADISQK